MRAMVLAAGLGTRLRPLTYELPKPMVPVLDRPVMAHILDLLERHGITEIVANLHYFPETIRDYFGDRITYSFEEELFGTAGGVRNCADFFQGEDFLVISGDALTDIDLDQLKARHQSSGGVATLAVQAVEDTREFGVVLHDSDGRINGFQEKPHPDEALSQLANCGIYMFKPEIFDYFPEKPFVDWAKDVFPTLLENDIPFFIHEFAGYWNDVGSLDELRQGTYDVLAGNVNVSVLGRNYSEGVIVGENSTLESALTVDPPIWIGEDVKVGSNVRLLGPLVIGDGAIVGDGASVRDSILLPGAKIAEDEIVIGAITASDGVTSNLRPHPPSITNTR